MWFLFLVLNAVVEGAHYYEGYNEEQPFIDYGKDTTTKADSLRVRRFEPETNTFDPDDEDQVKGALNQIFAGRRFDEPLSAQDFTSFLDATYNNISLSPITKINDALTLVRNWHRTTDFYDPSSKFSEQILEDIYRNATQLYHFFTRRPLNEIYFNEVDKTSPTRSYLADQIIPARTEIPGEVDKPERSTNDIPYRTDYLEEAKIPFRNRIDMPYKTEYSVDTNIPSRSTNDLPHPREYSVELRLPLRTPINMPFRTQYPGEVKPSRSSHLTVQLVPSRIDSDVQITSESKDDILRQGTEFLEKGTDSPEKGTEDTGATEKTTEKTTEEVTEETTTEVATKELPMCKPWPTTVPPTTTTTTTTQKTTVHFDLEMFLEIVANLTYDYYTNLTAQVNETVRRMSMLPTCPTLSPPPTEFDYMLFNDSMRGKCFVCGMDNTGIPVDADCADAFAGDFIPLVPQNPKAKGKIAQYRKYCAFRDVNNFVINNTMPRMMWGRWTGGCAVRWTDLTGIYTQRTCRSKYKAAVGKHYASKRMAKLEMALSHTDNGCIISPVATLLPLSRGISLFARFHACVCTGSWCNGATPLTHIGLSLLVAMVTSLGFNKWVMLFSICG